MNDALRRGVIKAVRLGDKLATVQAQSAGSLDDCEFFEGLGLAAGAHVGAEVVVAFLDGAKAHPVALAVADRTKRPVPASGEVVLYAPDGKQIRLSSSHVKLGEGATKKIGRVGDSVRVTIPAGTVCVGVTGGGGSPAVAVMNPSPITLDGTITSGSDVVRAVD